MSYKMIRLGIVGGNRGSQLETAIGHQRGRIKVTAVCDSNPAALTKWTQSDPTIVTFTDYDRMLQSDVCDAIFIVTPMAAHARHAIAAVRAGKHVLSEVTACVTHEEGLALIDAVEASGVTYMMAENYIYMRPHMMVQRMVDAGVFGHLTYAEGMYLHDCRPLMFKSDGSLAWRGEMARDMSDCNYYPTHSFGPIAKWLDIGRTDQIDSVMCMSSSAHGMSDYVLRRFGPQHPGANSTYWRRGDSACCMIKTTQGRLVFLRVDVSSHRPHHQFAHELQGTRAAFRTQIRPDEEPLIWIEGRSTLYEEPPAPYMAHDWDKIYKYADEFDDPRWAKYGVQALESGHCGGDYFIFDDFINTVNGDIPNPVNVYDGVTWSSIIWLSAESARLGRAVKAIDYTSRLKRQVNAPELAETVRE